MISVRTIKNIIEQEKGDVCQIGVELANIYLKIYFE